MTNNCVSTVFGLLGVLAALTFPVTPGNAAEAQTVLGGKLVVCGVCHGVDGSPKLEGVPIIWGLQENYILKQLHEFQRGDRASDTMKKIAVNLTEEEVGPAAAYFATKQWPGPANASSSSPPPTMAICEACHQQKLVGGVAAPRLAGQKYDYLVESMRRFAEGQRKNSAEMSSLMQAISASDREAMARSSAPSRYTGVSPVAQYTASARFGCVVSRPERIGSPPPSGMNSTHPCQVPSGVGAPLACAR